MVGATARAIGLEENEISAGKDRSAVARGRDRPMPPVLLFAMHPLTIINASVDPSRWFLC